MRKNKALAKTALAAAALALLGFQAAEAPKLSESDFTSAEKCGTCHQEIYQQWSTSLHSRSLSDPIYRAVVERVIEQTEGRQKVFCLSCHAPIASVSGSTLRLSTPINWDDFSAIASEGVTCDFCHTISGNENLGKNISVAAYNYPRRGELKIKYGRHSDADNKEHAVEESKFLIDAQFCATCHQFKHPLSLVEVQNTYEEWRGSSYYRKGIRCQDCHMPIFAGYTAEGGKKRERIHAHLFPGGHSEMLKTAAKISLASSMALGRTLSVRADVVNSGAGHSFPTGVPGVRELWMDVNVLDGQGRRLDHRRFNFGLRLLSNDGSEVMPWENFDRVEDHRIPPEKSRAFHYEVTLPEGLSGQVAVEAKLSIRLVSELLSRRLQLPVQEPIVVTSAKTSVSLP